MLTIPDGPGELRERLGRRLRDHRLSQNLTQTAVAARSGVPLSTLKRFERTGHASVDAFVHIAAALGLTGALEALFPPSQPATMDELLATPAVRRRGRRP
jgi:transcriptional regulator with XRE-family HTH domain